MTKKSRAGIGISILALGLGLLIRFWLLSLEPDSADTEGITPKLPGDYDPILARIDTLLPAHERKRPAQPGDWLTKVPEGGQSFQLYVQHRAEKPICEEFSSIDVRPLGEFDETQQRIVRQTAEFMSRFFGVSVQILDPQPLDEIPTDARKIRDDVEQILTTWILFEKLRPNRRPDAMATIGLVTSDLWPGGQRWVFGEASLVDRVGVWSLHRNGDPHEGEASFRVCLRRTLSTAVHETGHMLGIPHCCAYECGMNGSSSRAENDRRILEFCPHCQAKIWWSCGADPMRRCESLLEFCERTGLDRDAEIFRREVRLLGSDQKTVTSAFRESNGMNSQKETQ